MDFEFIDESAIQGVKRGRKSTCPPELVDALSKLPKGKAMVVKAFALDPKSATYGKDKATKGATIRTAGKQAGVKVSIVWTPAGVPQVKVTGKA